MWSFDCVFMILKDENEKSVFISFSLEYGGIISSTKLVSGCGSLLMSRTSRWSLRSWFPRSLGHLPSEGHKLYNSEAGASMVHMLIRVMSVRETPLHQRPPIFGRLGAQLAGGKVCSSGLLAADALVGIVRRDFSKLSYLRM